MIKTPAWCLEHIAELGQAILDDQIRAAEASEELARKISAKDPDLALQVLADWARRKLRGWIYDKLRDGFQENEVPDQGMLPFPDLPPYLEIAPGRAVHQKVMTGHDWDNALAIWRNRRDQAEEGFRRFERRYEQIRPLLTDDVTTTADVIDRLA